MSRDRSRQHGWNTVELMVALAIVSVGLMVVVQQVSISFRETASAEQRAFAYQRASSILHEVQNAIATGEIEQAADLAALGDAAENPVLTTRRDADGVVVPADHRMSGNVLRQGHWLWSRKLEIQPHGQPGLYYVKVSILRWDGQRWQFEANQTQLLPLEARADKPTQTYDVYALAIANAPSLAGDLLELRAALEAAANRLAQTSQARCNLHWITRLGYGRDETYAPWLNTATPADTAPASAFWLPSLLTGGDAPTWLYRSDLLGGTHRTDDGLVNGWSTTNPLPFALADHRNHCLRSPAAHDLFAARVAAGLDDDDEPPLQILLDRMHDDPDRYRGAIFVNLHGSALPMPPLRNHSDPAKDPTGRPGVRVVTHPTRLRSARDVDGNGDHADTEDVELRVYAWRDDPATAAVLAEPVLVQIFGVDLTASVNAGADPTLSIARLPGGIDTTTGAAAAVAYQAFDSAAGKPDTTGGPPFAMRYEVGWSTTGGGHTWIKLHNTPLVAPKVGTRGLDPAGRLFGRDYNPSPIVAGGAFPQDLAYDSTDPHSQRNTARWRLRIHKRAFVAGLLPNVDQRLRIVTRIGSDTTTGRRWPSPHQPANLSTTWAWWTADADAVPASERAQFQGDPRLCPYADLMIGGTTTPNGYNWHFDDLVAGADDARAYYGCLHSTRLQPGCGERTRADAPRLLALLRGALQASGAIWVQPCGTTAEHLVLGGEIARADGDLGLAPAAVALDGAPFGGGGTIAIDQVTPSASAPGGHQLLVDTASAWIACPWLGEHVPDTAFLDWLAHGTTPDTCQWRNLAAVDARTFGTAWTEPTGASIGLAGAALFVNHGNAPATFVHMLTTALAKPDGGLRAMIEATSSPTPSPLPAMRPYSLTASMPATPAFAFTDTYPRSTLTELEAAWASATEGVHGGDILRVSRSASLRMFVVPTSLTPAAADRSTACLSALQLGMRAVHQAGTPTLPGRLPQVPRLEIVEPLAGDEFVNPTAIAIRWRGQWLRFDGDPYTDEYPASFTEDERTLRYRLLVSDDLGVTWTSLGTGAAAECSTWPDDPAELLADAGVGDESFTIAVPGDSFPAGEYLLRIEAWRADLRCHSAAHQVRVLIRRT